MPDTLDVQTPGSIDAHPDFPAFFRQAQEDVFREMAPRLQELYASGNDAAAERLMAQVDQQARSRAVVATRAMLNFHAGQGGPGLDRPFTPPSTDTPTLSGAESSPQAPPTTAPAPTPDTSAPPPQTLTGAPVTSAPEPRSGIDLATRFTPADEPLPTRSVAFDWMHNMFSRPSSDMIARPLMPQSPAEEEDQRQANQRYATGVNLAAAGALASVPTAEGVAGGLALARLGGNLLARIPRATTLGAGATALTAGTTQATPPDPAQQASDTQGSIDKLREEQTSITAARAKATADLNAFRERFGRVGPGSPQADILALQTFLASPEGFGLYSVDQQGRPVRPDGIWFNRDGRTSGTQLAMQAYIKRLEDAQTAGGPRLEEIGRQLHNLNGQLAGYQATANQNAADEALSPTQRFMRDYGWAIGGGAGVLGSTALRLGLTWNAGRRAGAAAARANALLNEGNPDALARVAGVNRFVTEGGGEPPFRIAPETQAGFAPVTPQAGTHGLYPPPSPSQNWMSRADWVREGFGGGTVGYQWWRLQQAHDDLNQALADQRAEPSSRVVADRVAQARVNVAIATALMSAGIGGVTSYPIAAYMRQYRPVRPDVQRAEAEIMNLNRLTRAEQPPRPISDAEVMRRRQDRGFSIPRNAPLIEGETERWTSPGGENVIYRDRVGRWWRSINNGPAHQFPQGPPRTYRRISSVDDPGSSDTAVG